MGVIAMKKFHSKKKTTKIIIVCGNKKVVGKIRSDIIIRPRLVQRLIKITYS